MSEANKPHPVIHRQVSFSRAAFDHLKEWQRRMEAEEGRRFTNGQVLDRIILAFPLPLAPYAPERRKRTSTG